MVGDGFGRDIRATASATVSSHAESTPASLLSSLAPLSPTLGAPLQSLSFEAVQVAQAPTEIPVSSRVSLAQLGLTGKDVLTVSFFTREQLHQLFTLAHDLRLAAIHGKPLDDILKVLYGLFEDVTGVGFP